MYRLTRCALVLTAVALACWPALIQAGPTVPYKDFASGTVDKVVPTSQKTVDVQISGSGQATHLGRFSGVGSHTLNLQTREVLNGELTYTAADGSTILGTYSGSFTPLSPTGVRLDLTIEFTGGTRRLAGVTGTVQAVVISEGAVPGSHFAQISEGTLTKP